MRTPEFLWNSYGGAIAAGSNSYAGISLYDAKEGLVLDALLACAFVLFCLYVAFERLRHRI